MKKVLLAGIAALTIAGSTVVYAQQGPWWDHHRMRFSTEDRTAFADARIAAVHAGLRLSDDQEKLWPPVEAAVRDLAKLRIDRANARMQREDKDDDAAAADPIARLRERADNMAATSAALKKVADAADPLYKTLDDGQKRRLTVLTHGRFGGSEGWRWRHRWMMERGMMDRHDGDRGSDRDGGRDRDGSGRL